MKLHEIPIRDPFILPHDGMYYLYGTDCVGIWDGYGGFPCYASPDLENWEGPYKAFSRPDDNFWEGSMTLWAAPEVYAYRGKFYMFASFRNKDATVRVSQILVAEDPKGPFRVWSDVITPPDWYTLDGTLYIDEKNIPWMVFSKEWVQIGVGEMWAVQLADDLSRAVGEPVRLFGADEAPWVRDWIEYDRKCMVTDGPFMVRQGDVLTMFWASGDIKSGGYAEGYAVSRNGLFGPWEQHPEPIYAESGGHGMLFHTFDGRAMFTLHTPDVPFGSERARIFPIRWEGGAWKLER